LVLIFVSPLHGRNSSPARDNDLELNTTRALKILMIFVRHLEFLTEHTSETKYFNSKNSVAVLISSSSSSSSSNISSIVWWWL
jgi:hypothetical protein